MEERTEDETQESCRESATHEESGRKGKVRLTGMTVIVKPESEAGETLEEKMPKGRRP